uniref:RNase H type-1 domain-containing protein n=1 Tax=Tanacetum cinerariifolium TaxID=118510 RepID=A0A699HR77_TANCI|nr:hypothetical protein [Tanacetum cinerariifolium]
MDVPITFPSVSTNDVSDRPLMVEAEVEGYWIRRVFVDQRAAVQVMFEHCFDNLSPDIKARLAPTQTELVGFSGEQLIPIGKIKLKEDGTWRMCIDFKNLNSACPKDYYPLPEIDLKFEAIMGHPFKCFLVAYKGYHHIQMSKEDEDKTAFYTYQGTYCYVKMPFGLKNVEATYQRLIDLAFQTQLGRNLEAYVDDMVIKSKTEQDMIMDIAETFDNLRKINMKLNSMKCSFALNRFLSRSVERSLPFFETLKNITKENKEDYRWTEEAEHAFQELKKFILELPTLTTPELKETLFLDPPQSRTKLCPFGETSTMPTSPVSEATMILRGSLHKGQILADFINEIPMGTRHVEACNSVGEEYPKGWTLYTDGASSQKGVGAGLVLIDPSGTEYTYAIRLNFPSTNNEAKYEAHLAGLRIARKMKVQTLDVQVDSKLVACQMNGELVASNEGMEKYMAKAKEQAALFKKFSIKNIPRNQNQKADVLSKLASVAFNHLAKEILVEVLNSKSVDVQEVSTIVKETLRKKIGQYVVEDGVLFKKSYLSPMLRCVGPLQANCIIREVHEGACGMHAGASSVEAKIIRQWYYWPTMHGDTKEPSKFKFIIVGPLPEGPDKLKFIIVTIDYFTKWIEANPFAKTTESLFLDISACDSSGWLATSEDICSQCLKECPSLLRSKCPPRGNRGEN